MVYAIGLSTGAFCPRRPHLGIGEGVRLRKIRKVLKFWKGGRGSAAYSVLSGSAGHVLLLQSVSDLTPPCWLCWYIQLRSELGTLRVLIAQA